MRSLRVSQSLWIAGVLGMAAVTAFGAEMRVRVVAPEEVAHVGRVFPCYVVVEGVERPGRPDFSSREGLEVRFVGEHASAEKRVKRWTFTYDCLAREAGEISLEGIAVTAGGKTVLAEPLKIQVEAPKETEAMRLEVTLSGKECYVGEPVRLVFHWRSELFLNGVRAVDLRFPAMNDPRFKVHEPVKVVDPNDANAIGIPVENRRVIAELTEKRAGGTPMNDIRFEQILVPKEAGTLTIPGAVLMCSYLPPKEQKFGGFRYPSYFNNDFFDDDVREAHERYLARSEPLTLKVKALPRKGRPENFFGIVGRVGLEVRVAPVTAAAMDPMELSVRLTGSQYPHLLPEPPMREQSALAMQFDVAERATASRVNGGVRELSYTIRPLREMVRAVPVIRLAYFDPKAGIYGEAVSRELPVTISRIAKVDAFDAEFSDGTRLKNDVQPSFAGIWFNAEGNELLKRARPAGWWRGRMGFWVLLFAGPPAVLMLLGLVTKGRRFARRNPDGARARRAYAEFRRAVRGLRRKGDLGEAETIALLTVAVNRYMADRFGMNRGASSSEELAEAMEARRVDSDLVEKLEVFWDHAGLARYSRGKGNGSGLATVAREVPEVVRRIERELGG